MLKKALSFVLSFALLSTAAVAAPISAAAESTPHESKIFYPVLSKSNTPAFQDENGNEIDIDTLNNDVSVDSESLPESFDLREENRCTPVRDQGTEGLCWDFASVASIESNILSQPELAKDYAGEKINDLDISEGGMTWYIHTNLDDPSSPLNNDYNTNPYKGKRGEPLSLIASSLTSGFGTYPEALMPYNELGFGYSPELRFYSEQRLKEFNTIGDKDIELIKDKIIKDGAFAVYYHSFASNYNEDGDYTAYYDNGFDISSGDDGTFTQSHAVTIVGWDDSFSRDNFLEACKPQSDGAWLCKNSWGEGWGSKNDGGYFWISYETKDLIYYQFIMQSADEFDNIYQNQFTDNANCNAERAANVFTANGDEYLTQISLSTGSAMDYTASVYELSEGYTSPDDGRLLSEFEGSIDFNGIHTLELPAPVALSKGEIFSVVITNRNPSNSFFAIQTKDYYLEVGKDYQPGKCYYYDGINDGRGMEGSQWFDCAESGSPYGYAAIKAYTQNAERRTDKSALERLVSEAKSVKIGDELDASCAERFKERLENAEAVLDNADALQYEVNNACYLLNTSFKEINNYSCYINSEEDFIELYKKSISALMCEQPKRIVFNSDLDFAGYDFTFTSMFNGVDFSGDIEGNGHVIKNIKFFQAKSDVDNNVFATGIFGNIDGGSVSNLTIDSAKIEGYISCGSIVGTLRNGKISNCHLINSELRSTSDAGGIVGLVYDGIVDNCSVINSKIFSLASCGGITGLASNTNSVINSTVSGNAVSGMERVGRIAAIAYEENPFAVTVKPSYSVPYFKPCITITDDKCEMTSFLGTISSVASDDAEITRDGDKYLIPLGEKTVNISLDYVERPPEGFHFSCDFNKKITILEYFGDSSELIIPESIGSCPVTEISDNFSCADNDSVTYVSIPDSIRHIPERFFNPFANLESVSLGDGLTEIPANAFITCFNLHNIEFGKNISVIGESAFSCCPIESIVIPESVTEIRQCAFSSCTHLKSAVLPDSLTSIGDSAFYGCLELEEIDFGKNIKRIGESAFANCRSLLLTELPDSVEAVENYAFINSPISKIRLGKSIKEIGEGAFGYSNGFNDFKLKIRLPEYVINGYSSTEAERYANENGFKFVNLDSEAPDLEDNIFDYSIFKTGDVNLDGRVSFSDAIMTQKYALGLVELEDIQKYNALVYNYYKSVTIVNAIFIQKYVLGLEDSLEYRAVG